MKKILSLGLLVILFNVVLAQKKCCDVNSMQAFASLGNQEGFKEAHYTPIAYTHENALGKKITFPTSGGINASAYEIKSSVKSDKYLIVIHEFWGLNDYVMKESDKLYGDLKDVNILAIDMYDGKVSDVRDSAVKYMQSLTVKRGEEIIRGAISYVGAKAKIATIGWCFGGGWSLQTAIIAGKQAKGCIMYYGMPETDINKLKQLHTSVLAIFAKQDKWINADLVSGFEANMKKEGKELSVHVFDADHAFANPSNPKYNKQYTDEAYKLSMEYLKKYLK